MPVFAVLLSETSIKYRSSCLIYLQAALKLNSYMISFITLFHNKTIHNHSKQGEPFFTGDGCYIMKRYLEIGKIVTTHGVRGEVKVQPWCDGPEFFCKFKTLYSINGEEKFHMERSRCQGSMAIAKIKGIDTVESAQAMRGKVLYMDRADINLPKGSYFVADLIGMKVYDEDGKSYGVITDVLQTGANDVYEIKSDNLKSYYIPAIPSVILKTDLESNIMTIYPMEGLFDED